MPRKPTFLFDALKQQHLVDCLGTAHTRRREDPNCKSKLRDLTASLFLKIYPSCKLHANSLYIKALEFQKTLQVNLNLSTSIDSISDVASDTSCSAASETESTSDILNDCKNDLKGSDSLFANIQTPAPIGEDEKVSIFNEPISFNSENEISSDTDCSVPSLFTGNNRKEKVPRKKFDWDNEKIKYLLACYDDAKKGNQHNAVLDHLETEFKKAYPECILQANTLYRRGQEFKKVLNENNSSSQCEKDNVALDGEKNITFNKVVTCASESDEENEFAWDKEKEQTLLECMETARTNKNNKRIEIRLHDEFLKFYPTYPRKPKTLHLNALALESGKTTTLKSDKPKVLTWYQDKELYLVKCAVEAHKENQNNINIGEYEGRKGHKSNFEKILVRRFQESYSDVSASATLNKFRELKKKFKLEFETTTPTMSDSNFAMIMSYWQYGYEICVRHLFEGCCFICSTLLVYRGPRNPIPTKTEPQHVPVLDYYPEEFLNGMFKKTETQYYLCTVCKEKNLLQLYPLTPEGVKIRPIPEQLENLTSGEKNQIALVGVFSAREKVKNQQYHIFEHHRGEVNVGHKSNQAYFEMYALIVERSRFEVPNKPAKIIKALRLLHEINPLYQAFHAHYETLYRYYKPDPNAPSAIQIFSKKRVEPLSSKLSMDVVLEDEPAALLIPDRDLEARGTALMSETVAGAEHIKDFELAKRSARSLCWVTYDDPKLAEKIFPWLHPHGIGGYVPRNRVPMGLYYKWRISMVDDRFRTESNYCFYFLDALLKARIQYRNSVKVDVDNLQKPLTKDDFDATNIYTAKYGLEVPSTIPNSRNYWYVKLNELLALSAYMNRTPDLFVTLTQNDNWSDVQAVFTKGAQGRADIHCKENIDLTFHDKEAVDHPFEMVVSFYRRLQAFKDRVLHNKKGLCGEVVDYWYRIEYQQRGGLHVHCVIWCKEGTVPENVISAEMPRFEHPQNEKWREYVEKYEQHHCRPRCFSIGKNKSTKHCKYGFPYVLCDKDQIDEIGIRHLYKRRHAEDMLVVPYNLGLLLFWNGHVNVQKVTDNGWEMYLAKYVAKSASSVKVTFQYPQSSYVPKKATSTKESGKKDDSSKKESDNKKDENQSHKRDRISDVQMYLTTRLVSSIECCAILLQKHHASSSRDMIYLPIGVDPPSRFVKRREHMDDAAPDDIYYQNKLEKYLDRPDSLAELTYPQFYAAYYYGKGPQVRRFPDNNLWDEENEDDQRPETDESRERPLKDKEGRWLTLRAGREAVPYFRHVSPYGEQMELYCLKKLLENVPVDRESVRLLLSRTGSYMQECLDRNLINEEDEAMHFLEGCVKRGFSTERLTAVAHRLIEGNWLQEQDLKKLLETVAPYHLEIERARAAEIVDENDETAGLLNVPRRVPLHEYVKKFSDTQLQAYKYITSRWAEGKIVRAFVSGEAGCGKSFLMEALAAYCKENGRTVQKLGTTGCAAYLIGGWTIHSFFKLDIHRKCYLEHGTNDAYFVKKVNVIMIDEVSMLEKDLLLKVDELLREFTDNPYVPYGGKSVIMFGDVAQLPAIRCNIWCYEVYAKYFDTIVLRDNKRAEKDQRFVQLLNRARVKKLTDKDWQLLESRIVPVEKTLDFNTPHGAYLVAHRKTKAEHDQARLDDLEGEAIEYVAEDVDPSDNPVSEGMAEFIKKIEHIAKTLPKVLRIKVGAKVMLLRNKSFRHGWVNGRFATVLCATRDYIVLQALDNPSYRTVLERTKQEIKWPKSNVLVYRKQFPIELAYAVTIHKSQGQTLDKVIVRASHLFATGQFYTAISRVTCLESLQLTALDHKSVIFADELAHLLEWFDKVDVLRGFKGEKPEMPRVPPNWDMWRVTRTGKKKAVRMEELMAGLFSSESEDEGKKLSPPSPNSAFVSKKKKRTKSKKTTAPPKATKEETKNERKTFKSPPSVEIEKNAIVAAFHRIRAIPINLEREAYKDKFYDATRNVNLESFKTNMRTQTRDVTFNRSFEKFPENKLYRNMGEHCTVVRTAADGHCMFNMAAINLFGNQRQHLQVRAAVLLVFIENWQHFEDMALIYGFETVQQLVHDTCCCEASTADLSSWGSNAHLKALAVASGREVYVYLPLLSTDELQFLDAPARGIQEAIDQGTTPHMRYLPFEPTQGATPIMTFLSEQHFSAVVKNRSNSMVFVPKARGDVPLDITTADEVPTVIEIRDEDGQGSLAESFRSQATISKTHMTSVDNLDALLKLIAIENREQRSPISGIPIRKRNTPPVSLLEKSSDTPRTRRKLFVNETTVGAPAAPSKSGQKRAAATPERSPAATPRSRRKISQKRRDSTDSASSVTSQVSSTAKYSQPHKISEKTTRKLLEQIKKIPARTGLRNYVQQVLKLTEAAEMDSFAEAVRNAEPATLRRSMAVHTAAHKLTYKALTEHAAVVKTGGTGDCVFEACSTDLFGTETQHLQLRAAACHVIARNYKHFDVHKISLGKYESVQKLIYGTCCPDDRTPKVTWASRAHIKAIATMANRQVYVYLPLVKKDRAKANVPEEQVQSVVDESKTEHAIYRPIEDIDATTRTPLLLFVTANHFSAVVPLKSPCSFVIKPKIIR